MLYLLRGDYMPFGDKLKNARINAGLTQKQLANLIGAKHNSISNWENNQNMPDPNMIETICGALNVSPSYLLINNSDSLNDPYFIAPHEQAHIKKYRQLNADGQSKVDEYTTDLVDSGKYASEENINTEDKAASVTDFKPANKGKVLHGRAVAFGGATMETEIDEDTAREIAELRKKLDEKQNNN